MRQLLRVVSRARPRACRPDRPRRSRPCSWGAAAPVGTGSGGSESATAGPAHYTDAVGESGALPTSARSRSRVRQMVKSLSASRSVGSRLRPRRARPLARHGRGSGDRQCHVRRCRRGGVHLQRDPRRRNSGGNAGLIGTRPKGGLAAAAADRARYPNSTGCDHLDQPK